MEIAEESESYLSLLYYLGESECILMTKLASNIDKINEYKQRAKSLVAQMTLDEKIRQMLHAAPAIERLAFRPITGGTNRCTEWQEPGQRPCFRRRSGWRRHSMRI